MLSERFDREHKITFEGHVSDDMQWFEDVLFTVNSKHLSLISDDGSSKQEFQINASHKKSRRRISKVVRRGDIMAVAVYESECVTYMEVNSSFEEVFKKVWSEMNIV